MRPIIRLAVLAFALCAVLFPSTGASATGTFLQIDSQPGDPLGGGVDTTFNLSNATFRAWSNGEDTFVSVYSPLAGGWEVQISSPRGSGQLVPGTYTDIGRSAFRAWGQPGMDVTSPAGGCNTVSGTFTVNEAAYGPYLPGFGYLRVIAFDATFAVSCSGAPALLGHVRYEDPPDLTPPTISPVSDLTTEAEDSTGTNVYYETPYASDTIDPSPTLSCDPPYGARFPIGESTVTCTATDYSGNMSQASFTVTVLPPLEYALAIDRHGNVDKSGVATIGGTITCSRPGSYAFVAYGEVIQQFTKRVTLTGAFNEYTQFDCSPTPTRWSRAVKPPNGMFKAGEARVEIYSASACYLRCFYFSQSADISLRAKS